MIRFIKIALRRGRQLLFENASLDFHAGEKIGLVGDNGSGKTSLLLMLTGVISQDQGDIDLPRDTRISHATQETPSDYRSALDYVIDGDAEYRRVEKAITACDHGNDAKMARLFARMEELDGYTVNARAAKLLSGLGFEAGQHNNETRTFSGGWRVRLNLAQALLRPSDLLLLDEPTNHLDLDTIIWLEDWLRKYPGTLILISHDREFIDACCKRILHIENCSIRSYPGNYSQFELQRGERLANEQSMYAKQRRKIAHMENFIRRFRYKASKARQAQSRIKAMEKLQLGAPAHVGSPFTFKFKSCARVSDPILSLEQVDAGYSGKTVLSAVNLSIAGGDRIGLLGANGAGKSTLIKIMAAELEPMTGTRTAAKNLRIGYFAQHQLDQLDPGISPMDQFTRLFPAVTTQEIRRYLGGYDFQGDRVTEKISNFSGGEKARLALALLIFDQPNLLLLDEPTNHLDMEMRHALAVAIQEFEGAIILVSHDRNLLDSVTDELWLINAGKVEPFGDDIAAYLKFLRRTRIDDRIEMRASGEPGPSQPQKLKGYDKKHKRQQSAKRREQLKTQQNLTRQLQNDTRQLQAEIDELDVVLSDPQTYESESTANLAKMMRKNSLLVEKLTDAETRWYEVQEEIERLESSLKVD
jgi:ATP-binding cassette subfamily F protein 3